MSAQQTGIVVLLIIGITFVFDVMELQPRVGFSFLRSLNYVFYHLFRVLLGLLAAFLILQINPDLYLPLLAFLAVLGSVTTLQNFAVNVGGSEVGSLSRLLDHYKERMLAEQEQRNVRKADGQARSNDARSLQVQGELRKVLSLEELEMQLRLMLLQSGWNAAEINTHVQEPKNTTQSNEQFLEAIMAFQVTEMNLGYVRSLIEEHRRGPTISLPPKST